MLKILSISILLSFSMATPALAGDSDEGFISESWSSVVAYFSDDGDNNNSEDNDELGNDNTGNTGVPPALTIPNPVNIEATGLQSNVAIGIVTAVDSLGNPVTVASNAPATFPIGTTIVTYAATDVYGNVATTIQTITVADTTPPVITPPAAMTINSITGQAIAVNIGIATATDIFTPINITNNAPATFPLGTTTVTWTATDTNGNSSTATQLVTVVDAFVPADTTPPTITIQQPAITVEAVAVQSTVNLGAVTATDIVDGMIAPTNNAPAVFPLGITTVTWKAIDAAGNTATAQQQVAVQDTTPPVITVPAAVSGVSQDGYAVAVNIGTATATDAFNPVSMTNNAPAKFPVGRTTVTWTAIDANNNTGAAPQLVTVTDNSIFANLPADPGAAGMATLAGIDSDGDGIRDDVQRWIVMTYPNSQKTRASLRQLAQDYQRFILNAASPTQIYDAARLMGKTSSCLSYILPVGQFISTVAGNLRGKMLNTYARSKAFLQADGHLSGRMYKGLSYENRKQGCSFNPDAMPN